MAKSKKSELTKFIDIQPIVAEVAVTGDHVVALLVSQVDESISAKERDTQEQLEKSTKHSDALLDKLNKAVIKIGDDETAKAKKTGILEKLKQLGFKKPAVSVSVQNYDQEGKISFCLVLSSNDARDQIETRRMVPAPAGIAALNKSLKSESEESQRLRQYLLELRTYRQTQLPGLERWAKGQIAAQALKKAGGQMGDFIKQLEKIAPSSLKHLLMT